MRRSVLAGVLLLALAAGCQPVALQSSPGEYWVRTELFFGMGMEGGREVSGEQWKAFLAEEVTPRFPEGLTVLAGDGQWAGKGGVEREHSRILIIVHPATEDASGKLEQIRGIYCRKFHQKSVMRVDSVQKVDF